MRRLAIMQHHYHIIFTLPSMLVSNAIAFGGLFSRLYWKVDCEVFQEDTYLLCLTLNN